MAWSQGFHQGIKELDRVWAPRHMPWGREEQIGIVHRIHGDIATIQFPSDQHRIRLPVKDILDKKMEDFEPKYPTVRMHPGSRMPTAKEVQLLEYETKLAVRNNLPPPPLPPGFEFEDPRDLKTKHVSRVQHWGISEPTLDALRNRSLPSSQVAGYYDQHFYSNLYDNNFYRDFRGGYAYHRGHDEEHHHEHGVPGERYYPLDGPPVEMMEDGTWRIIQDPYMNPMMVA